MCKNSVEIKEKLNGIYEICWMLEENSWRIEDLG